MNIIIILTMFEAMTIGASFFVSGLVITIAHRFGTDGTIPLWALDTFSGVMILALTIVTLSGVTKLGVFLWRLVR